MPFARRTGFQNYPNRASYPSSRRNGIRIVLWRAGISGEASKARLPSKANHDLQASAGGAKGGKGLAGLKTTTPSGGMTRLAEAGLPCEGVASASTYPPFPMLLPP